MIMFFRAGLSDIHNERNNAKKAVDNRDLKDLDYSLRRMNTLLVAMIAEVDHQMEAV